MANTRRLGRLIHDIKAAADLCISEGAANYAAIDCVFDFGLYRPNLVGIYNGAIPDMRLETTTGARSVQDVINTLEAADGQTYQDKDLNNHVVGFGSHIWVANGEDLPDTIICDTRHFSSTKVVICTEWSGEA